jgi:hypothetical protein
MFHHAMCGLRNISGNFKSARNHYTQQIDRDKEEIHEARKPRVSDLRFFGFGTCHSGLFRLDLQSALTRLLPLSANRKLRYSRDSASDVGILYDSATEKVPAQIPVFVFFHLDYVPQVSVRVSRFRF